MVKKYLIILCASAILAPSAVQARNPLQSYDWFWFLYEKDSSGVFPSESITPFYYHAVTGTHEYTASLPPVIFTKYFSAKNVSRTWLFGLAGDVDYTHADGAKDYDLGIMPFVLYGNSPDPKDRYFFFWPAGGTFKGKLAMEYISPWIFPGIALAFLYPPSSLLWVPLYAAAAAVPAYVSYGRGDYKAHGIFWPFIQWGDSPDRKDFRILPFYSHNTKKDYYDNRSWLMLFIYTQSFLHNGREEDTFMAFPFFARRWSNDGVSGGGAVLWPFFSWGYNTKRGDSELNCPWPLFIYQRSEKPFIRKLVCFPFYGDIRYEKDRTFFVTPLYFSLKRDNDTFRSSYHISAFIFWYFTRDYKKSPSPYYGTHWRYFK
ncbi:MAG: hypothetical protein ACRCUT_05460, partial [Spirochaetota bacterium]